MLLFYKVELVNLNEKANNEVNSGVCSILTSS